MKPWKGVCFGALLWVIMFAVISVFITFNIYESGTVRTAGAMISGFVALAMIVYLRPKTLVTALGYGITWVLVGLILDLLITWRFNENIFYSWSLWAGYLLVLVAVMLGYFSQESENGETKEKSKEPEHPTDINI